MEGGREGRGRLRGLLEEKIWKEKGNLQKSKMRSI